MIHYKKVDDRRIFIERLCASQPILDPIDNIQTSTNALQNTNHIIAHKEIYAMAKSSTNAYRRLEMSQIFFTLTILSSENASLLKKEILVSGGELEHYIHNTANIKDRLLLDGTQSNTMSSIFKMRNTQNVFNQNIPVQNMQQLAISNHNPSQNLDQIFLNHNQLSQFMVNQLSQNSLNNGDNSNGLNYHYI